jgi:transcriptional regulator GlxA family with amidase domain
MVKAFEMILGTDRSMTDIAYAVGYHSLSALSTTFHQFTNLSPSTFNHYKT